MTPPTPIAGTVTMTRDDVMRETVKHVRRVGVLMLEAIAVLQHRAVLHDDSKFSPEEFDAFAAETPALRGLTYGSDEYKAALARLGPALAHHYKVNNHHPEHFDPKAGVDRMDLIQLLEMLCDWKAATERHTNGSLPNSIAQNAERFGYDDKMARLLCRTAANLGWMTEPEWQAMPVVPDSLTPAPTAEVKVRELTDVQVCEIVRREFFKNENVTDAGITALNGGLVRLVRAGFAAAGGKVHE